MIEFNFLTYLLANVCRCNRLTDGLIGSAPLYFRTLWRYRNCIIIITECLTPVSSYKLYMANLKNTTTRKLRYPGNARIFLY